MKDEIISYLKSEEGMTLKVAETIYSKLESQPDILNEFEYYLKEKKFPEENERAIVIQGYSAKRISETATASFLHPIGVYTFLLSLRENPEVAMGYLKNGFPRK